MTRSATQPAAPPRAEGGAAGAPAAARLWAIAGGGTGGHVTPALALAEVIAAGGDRVLFLGSDRGLEARLVPEAGFELVTLPARPVMGVGARARLRALAGLPATTRAAARALRRERAGIVVSVGGYAAAPAVAAASLLRVPLVVFSPDTFPGRVNRLAARFAARIFVGFEGGGRAFGARRAARVRCEGIPVRRALRDELASAPPRRTPAPPFRLLVFGGSQGARQINEALIAIASRLDPAAVRVFHQSGAADRERVVAAYARAGVEAEVVAFEPAMAARYRWADLAICRAGAVSLAELALAGLPAVLVPFPYASDDHQAANARERVAAGAAIALDPRPLDPERLLSVLVDLFREPERIAAMSAAAARLARPDAAARIVHACRELLAAPRGAP